MLWSVTESKLNKQNEHGVRRKNKEVKGQSNFQKYSQTDRMCLSVQGRFSPFSFNYNVSWVLFLQRINLPDLGELHHDLDSNLKRKRKKNHQ